MFKKNRGDYARISVPKSVNVCGVEIKKLPLGAYIDAMEAILEAPFDFMALCFEGRNLESVLEDVKNLEPETVKKVLAAIFRVMPEYTVRILSKLTGIDERRLLEDSSIGIDGVCDLILAVIEVNGLGKLMSQGERILKSLNLTHIGFKE